MLKVLIVDDEFLVRVGLESTIPWSEYGFHVVGSARNGKEAIQLFEQYDPDVLLTDIKMPVMGGLELIEKLKSVKPSLVAIIITHYDDFNYAKEALKLGANDYVLKTELFPDNLIKIINKHVGNDYAASHREPQPEEDTFHDLGSEEDFLKIKALCEDFVADKPFIAAIVKLYHRSQKEEKKTNVDLVRAFHNISSNVPSSGFTMQTFSGHNREVLYVFSFDHTDHDYNPLLDYIKLLRENASQYLDVATFVGISSFGCSIQELRKAIVEASQSLELSFFESTEIMLYKPRPVRLHFPCPTIDTTYLKQTLAAGDHEGIKNYIQKILDQLEASKSVENARIVYSDFLSFANETAEELKLDVHFQLEFNDFPGFESFKTYIFSIFNQLQTKNTTYSFIIAKCIKFIEENYMTNISLSDLADFTHKSKSYLSTLFKMETGVNFSLFLINYRIEKAKQLLKESDCKIYEIAERVGFNNPYYFSKVFKETTGLNCKAYRDRNFQVGANHNG